MAVSIKDEARLLTKEELELVANTRGPALAALSDKQIADLRKLLRERAERARDIANQQKREMRGKAAPAGVKPAADNAGTRQKSAVLAAAVRRLSNEVTRRAKDSAAPSQAALARKAYRLKRASEPRTTAPTYRTAQKGMRRIENEKTQDLVRPMEVGRVSQFVKDAQAKRDAR
ncbi:MAG: hypothetical protein ACK4MF_08430 [Hyphomicrobiaceae bacterium]